MTIELHPVKSSQIAALGHDAENKLLRVQFHPTKKQTASEQPGSIYEYLQVTQADYDALINAESIGSAFIKGIKADPVKFPYRKIEPQA